MKNLINKAKNQLYSSSNKLVSDVTSGIKTTVKNVVDGLPVFISLERKSQSLYDEKHYFVIPLHSSEAGFSLHSTRSLPAGVPEINDLPKRRIFHFPNMHYEATLREHLISTVKEEAKEKNGDSVSSLENLANHIDKLDSKLTYGMLIIGGVAAIFNPLLGAGIAAKAVMPSVSGLLVKYGLKPYGEKLTQSQLEKQAREAEKKVLSQFSEANTVRVVNPILQELEFALRTSEEEHDPMLDPNLSSGSIPELDNEYWRTLTEKAIYDAYKEIIDDPVKCKAAKLGPEDIRWLNSVFANISKTE